MKILDFLKHCLNPKVILAVAVIIIGLFIFLPSKSQLAVYVPFLLALICPLSMIFMMKDMHSSNKPKNKSSNEDKKYEK